MSLIFDHNQENLMKALGFDEKDSDELYNKLSTLSGEMLGEELRVSEIAKKLANSLSYKELLLIATKQVVESNKKFIEENPHLLLLKLIGKKLSDLEEEV